MKVACETYCSVKLVDVPLLDLGCRHEASDGIFILITGRIHDLVHELIDIDLVRLFLPILGCSTRAVQEIVRVACCVRMYSEDVQELP